MAATGSKAERGQRLSPVLEANADQLLTCVHCGLCLPVCPTYRVLGDENDSPRGRIYLMRAYAEQRIEPRAAFRSHLDACLGCRACESACPSSVPYGQLLEAARAELSHSPAAGYSFKTWLTRQVLSHVFTRPWALRAVFTLAAWVRDSGVAQIAFESGSLPKRMKTALALLLASRSPFAASSRLRGAPADKAAGAPGTDSRGESDAQSRVALLRGCVMEHLFKPANRATEQVLLQTRCEIVEARGQACCGALHLHAGEVESAKALARRNIDAFLSSHCDRIITNSAGCGAAMKEYDLLLADDAEYSGKAREFSKKVRDISAFLSENEVERPARRLEFKVAYDAPCHLFHAQKVRTQPVDMLELIPGVEVVCLDGYETCCGGAGIYNFTQPDLSSEILSEKIEAILNSGADMVATGNPGCIMQMGAGLMSAGSHVKVVHPVELLAEAYRD